MTKTTAVAAVVFAALWFNGAYYATAAGVFGAAVVVTAAGLLLYGKLPSRPALLSAGTLVALGAWSVASVAWGGLPHVAWRFAGLAATAAGAVLLGSAAGSAGRRWLWGGILAGVGAHAVMTLVVVGTGDAPDDWFVGRQLESTVGYHNALGLGYAMAVPLGLHLTTHAVRPVRSLGAATAVVLVAAALLTQSRGTALAIVVAVVAQAALSRSTRLAWIAMLLAPAVGILLFALRGVDEALVASLEAETTPASGPFATYAVVTSSLAVALSAAAALPAPSWLRRRAIRRGVAAVGVVTIVAGVALVAAILASRADDIFDRLTAQPNSVAAVGGGETRLTSLSTTGRLDQWRVALEMIEERPLSGHGAGRFAVRWGTEREDKDLYVLQPHSVEFESVAELGILGGAMLVVLAGAVVALLRRGLRRDRTVGAAAASCMLAFALVASVDWTYSFPVLLATAFAVVGSAGGAGRRPMPLDVAVVAVASLVSLVILVGPAVGHWYLERSRDAESRSLEDAARLAERAAAFAPWDPQVISQRARLAEGSGDFERAAQLYADAAARAQQPWTDLYRRARALTSAGRLSDARRACDEAQRLNPPEEELYRGVCADSP